MTTFFTSDLHLGHANIIRYSGRPFASIEEMDAALVAAWNEVVGPGDVVWVLGDVAMGRIAETLELVTRLHGTKHLVVGNHDRCFRRPGASPKDEVAVERWIARYKEVGFAELVWGSTSLELPGFEDPVDVCHFPYEGDSHDEDRYVEQRPPDRGRVLLHGHVHEAWRRRGSMLNVGVDAWAGRPVAAAELAAAAVDPQPVLAPLAWAVPGPAAPLR